MHQHDSYRITAWPTPRAAKYALGLRWTVCLLSLICAAACLNNAEARPQTPIEQNDPVIDGEAPGTTSIDVPATQTSAKDESTETGATANAKSLLAVMQSGGPLMIPLGVCSVVLLVFVFERLISLRRSRVIPGPLVTRILEQIRDRQLDREQAVALCEDNPYPVCEVLGEGLRKWGRSSVEVEQAILDSGERVSNELKRNLRVINGVATVTPLLGLLGTVLGMIHAFDAIATISPSSDPKLVIATGISQALLTTAAGLCIAIPAIIAHMYFASCVDRRVVEIDAIGLQLVRLISAEGLSESPVKPSKRVQKAA